MRPKAKPQIALGNIYDGISNAFEKDIGNIEMICENFNKILRSEVDKYKYLQRHEFIRIKNLPSRGICTSSDYKPSCEHERYCKGGCLAISHAMQLAKPENINVPPIVLLENAKEQEICRFGWEKC